MDLSRLLIGWGSFSTTFQSISIYILREKKKVWPEENAAVYEYKSFSMQEEKDECGEWKYILFQGNSAVW